MLVVSGVLGVIWFRGLAVVPPALLVSELTFFAVFLVILMQDKKKTN